jgi:hypothetical protein
MFKLTKQEIFELYANMAYEGQRGSFSINGFGEAAAAYFNKDIKNLKVTEGVACGNHYYLNPEVPAFITKKTGQGETMAMPLGSAEQTGK